MSQATTPATAEARALAALRSIKRELEDLEYAQREPIAVVGMACRLPGDADTPELFWKNLCEGRDAVTEVPKDRWEAAKYADPNYEAPGKMVSRNGAFLRQIDHFDAPFFGISAKEARHVDPQQRLMLEVSVEALEDAGIPLTALGDMKAGIMAGICNNEVGHFTRGALERVDGIEPHTMSGVELSINANRVSYVFDLRGPSITVNTACSSSLVALHMACQSLRSREADLMLAGGSNVIYAPQVSVALSKLRALSPDGRCKTFDASANGYGRGEGCAVIVLKRLSDALDAGDRILALVRGSATNHDGHNAGLTVPNAAAQEALVREALERAGIEPKDVRYIEAHGTGTKLGDPNEVMALSSVLSEGRAPGSYCALGSVKTNIGHLESAAGISGVVKAILCVREGKLPASLHYKEPNPHIPFGEIPLRVQRELGDWPPGEGPRVAGVSSFGFGGTNAHVVLSEAPAEAESESREGTYAYCVSARTEEALQGSVKAHASWLRGHVEVSFSDASYTSSVRRTHHEERVVVVASSREEAAEKLESQRWRRGRTEGTRRSKVAFVMSGQGPQWPGMGRELHRKERVYREAVEEVAAAIVSAGGPRVLEETGRLDETEVTQPALFALQVGVCAQWASWGLKPDVVVGHSIGEVAAAYVSGVLSLESASRLVVARGRAMQRATGLGKMASVRMSRESLTSWLREHGYWGRVGIGAHNGPETTVLSGEREAVEEVVKGLEGAKLLPVNYAFHSGQMESLSREFGSSVSWLRGTRGSVPWVSTQTGEEVSGETLSGEYWVTQMRQPVEFAKAMGRVYGMGVDHVVEVSPHPVLVPALQEQIDAGSHRVTVLSTLRRQENERGTMLDTLGALHVAGYPVDWAASHDGHGRVVSLPTYAWQRQRYWYAPKTGVVPTQVQSEHPLLGERVSLSTSALEIFQSTIRASEPSFLSQHQIQGNFAFPGTGYLEIMASAGERLLRCPVKLEQVEYRKFLALTADDPVTVQLVMSPSSVDGALDAVISSRAGDGEWKRHATGRVVKAPVGPAFEMDLLDTLDVAGVQARCTEIVSASQFYDRTAALGVKLGAKFQGCEQLWRRDDEVLARVRVPKELESELGTYGMHPALLDVCFHGVLGALPFDDHRSIVPVGVSTLSVLGPISKAAWFHATTRRNDSGLTMEVGLYDAGGTPLVTLQGSARYLERTSHAAPTAEPVRAPPPNVPSASHDDISQYLQGELGSIVSVPAERVGLAVAFSRLGLDSLLMLDFRDRIEARLGVKLSTSDLFNHSSVERLARYITQRMAPVEALVHAEVTRAEPAAAPAPDELERMSDVDARTALESLLTTFEDSKAVK